MFDVFDDTDHCYEIVFDNGVTKKWSAQKLYEYYVFNELDFVAPKNLEFVDIKHKLDKGEILQGTELNRDWFGNNTSTQKFTLRNNKVKLSYGIQVSQKEPTTTACRHENKYVNQAGGIKFWVCPNCKKDLGDAT